MTGHLEVQAFLSIVMHVITADEDVLGGGLIDIAAGAGQLHRIAVTAVDVVVHNPHPLRHGEAQHAVGIELDLLERAVRVELAQIADAVVVDHHVGGLLLGLQPTAHGDARGHPIAQLAMAEHDVMVGGQDVHLPAGEVEVLHDDVTANRADLAGNPGHVVAPRAPDEDRLLRGAVAGDGHPAAGEGVIDPVNLDHVAGLQAAGDGPPRGGRGAVGVIGVGGRGMIAVNVVVAGDRSGPGLRAGGCLLGHSESRCVDTHRREPVLNAQRDGPARAATARVRGRPAETVRGRGAGVRHIADPA